MSINPLVCGVSTGQDVANTVNELIVIADQISANKQLSRIKDLPVNPRNLSDFNVISYYGDGLGGGGFFVFDAAADKQLHNGGTIIAPEAISAWDGTPQQIGAFLSWAGTGTGCYVRQHVSDTVDASFFGLSPQVPDAALCLNEAFSASKNVTVGTIRVPLKSTIQMPLNSSLIGVNSVETVFLISEEAENSHVLRYGASYEYGGYRGKIYGVRFESGAPEVLRGRGIILNSGIRIEDVAFYEMKSVIVKTPGVYIDKIDIDRCFFGYCGSDSVYSVIDIQGDTDAFSISNCHAVLAYQESTPVTFKDGLFLDKCNSASFDNNILNVPVRIDRSRAVVISSYHNEGSQHPNYKGNKSFLQITRSAVTIDGAYFHQRVDGPNVIIQRVSASDTQESCTVNMNNVRFVVTPNFDSLLQNGYPDQIELQTLCTLTIDGAFVTDAYPNINSNPLIGVKVTNAPMFNKFSNFFSKRAVISNNGFLNAPGVLTVNNSAMRTNGNRNQSSGSNTNIPWYKSGDSGASYTFTTVLVYDDARKLAALRNTSPQTVTNVTTGTRGILVRNNTSQNTDGNGAFTRYYRGVSAGNYDSFADVPASTAYYLFDKGLNVNGCPVVSRTVGDIDTFTYVAAFRLLDEANVEFQASTPPSIGVFVAGDVCVNTNRTAGQPIQWVYNGTAWVVASVYS